MAWLGGEWRPRYGSSVLLLLRRGAHSLNRRRKERDLNDCKRMVQRALKRRDMVEDVVTQRVRAWSDEHLQFDMGRGDHDSSLTRMVRLAVTHGWTRGIPPKRSLAWFVAQGRRLNDGLVARVFLSLRTPYVAWDFFEWLRQQGYSHSGSTCALLLRTYCISMRHDAALKMFKKEFRGTPLAGLAMYNVLLQGHFNAGCVDEAMKLFEGMKGSAHGAPMPTSDTHAIVVKGLCRNDKVKTALDILLGLLEGDRNGIPSPTAFYTIIDTLRKEKRMDDALKLFSRMRRGLKEIVSFTLMIKGLCEADRAAEAKRLLWEVSDRWFSLDPDLFSVVAMALRKEEKIDDALAVLERMVSRFLVPRESLRKSLTDMLWKSEQMSRKDATDLVEKICEPLQHITRRRGPRRRRDKRKFNTGSMLPPGRT